MFNLYSLNRTESITAFYYAIKQARIRALDWDVTGEYLKDCLNLIRIPSETPGGASGFLYRKHGAKSDDILHALNFAYVVGRVYLQENIIDDKSLMARMKQTITTNKASGRMKGFEIPEAFSL